MYVNEPARAFPPVITLLLILNGGAFLATLGAPILYDWFALWPLGSPDTLEIAPGRLAAVPDFWLWQLVSYGFLHGGLAHILFNMFTLWMFGSALENFWGSRGFLQYYLVCVVGAGLVQLLVSSIAALNGQLYPTVGASGGVFGILLAFGMVFPNRMILLLIPPVPLKAKYAVILFGGLALLFGITGMMPGVAHFAHLGGMLFGLAFLLLSRR